ncbi:MAG: tRNA (guanosine(18)-2'-O)-methyltransferase TrmH [Gammaproteobacteria bacterium]|nr:tRNA (guanosine(18)-2'-O)-methyltransferase TrmH [Gammaproteobacteria bacterium]
MSESRYAKFLACLNQRQPDLTVLMEQVHKPHNLSAVMRTCDQVGIGVVHAVPITEGPFQTKFHTSGSAARWLDVVLHDSVEAGVAALKAQGMQLVVADLCPTAVDYRQVDYTKPTAVLLGAEREGVTGAAKAAADHHVIIPMRGLVQSLNVSVAAALILNEAMGQRERAGMYAAPRLGQAEIHAYLLRWLHPTIAEWCDARGLPYPALYEDGGIVTADWQRIKALAPEA